MKLERMRKEIVEKEHGVQKVLSEAVKDAQEGKVTEAAEAMMVKKLLEKEKEQEIAAYKKEKAAQDADEEPNDRDKVNTEPLTKEEEEVFRQAAEIEEKEAAAKAAKELEDAKGKVNGLPDLHSQCRTWAQAGECQANTAWMMSNCARSCVGHMLNMKNDEKIDAHADCSTWAANGECKKNADWMSLNCQKSCAEVAAQPEPTSEAEEVVFAPTRGRKIVHEGHEIQDGTIVRGRLKSTKYDESLAHDASTNLPVASEDEMSRSMNDFQQRMMTFDSKAPKRAESFTVKKNKVAQGRFKSRHDVEHSTKEKEEQHKKMMEEKKIDREMGDQMAKMSELFKPKVRM